MIIELEAVMVAVLVESDEVDESDALLNCVSSCTVVRQQGRT